MRNTSEKSEKGGRTHQQRRYTKLPFCFFPFRAPPPFYSETKEDTMLVKN